MPLCKLASLSAILAIATATLPSADGVAQSYVAPPQPPGTPAYESSHVTTPTHAVFLRAGPVAGAPIIGTLRPGMQVEVLATANHGWVQVRSPAGTGWAYGSYLAGGASEAARSDEAPPIPAIMSP